MRLDPRIEFYLKHEQQIEDWANLKKLASEEANKFFVAVVGDLEAAAAKFPGEPKFEREFDQAYPTASCWRPCWEEVWKNEEKKDDWFVVGFQWRRSLTSFDKSWGGVICHRNFPSSPLVRAAIREAATKGGYKEEPWWPAKRILQTPREEYYADLDAFKADLVRQMEAIWRTFYPILDGVAKESKRR